MMLNEVKAHKAFRWKYQFDGFVEFAGLAKIMKKFFLMFMLYKIFVVVVVLCTSLFGKTKHAILLRNGVQNLEVMSLFGFCF